MGQVSVAKMAVGQVRASNVMVSVGQVSVANMQAVGMVSVANMKAVGMVSVTKHDGCRAGEYCKTCCL